jgi:predicted transcriptional regulator
MGGRGPLEAEILNLLTVAGGKAEGVRHLATKLGRPRSTVSDECHRLAATGRITMSRGTTRAAHNPVRRISASVHGEVAQQSHSSYVAQ